jgi:hypothetical protein
MVERESPSPVPEVRDPWDPLALGLALNAYPIPRVHAAYGEGHRYALGGVQEEPQADLEVFAQSRVVRYASEGMHVTLIGSNPGVETDHGVVFYALGETESRSLIVNPLGEATVTVFLRDDPLAQPAHAQAITSEPLVKREKEDKCQTLAGRLVNDPVEGRTKNGVLMARLSLRPEGEQASKEIFAFGSWARDILDYFHKDGDYTIIAEPKTVRSNGNQREIFSLKRMKLGLPKDPWD